MDRLLSSIDKLDRIYLHAPDFAWKTPAWWFDNFILLKLPCYRNNPRGWFHCLQALWLSVLFAAFTYIVFEILGCIFPSSVPGNKLDTQHLAIVFKSTVILTYARINSVYRDQWKYCAELYNSIQMQTEPLLREKLFNNLCHDLLLVNLWGHRNFKGIFKEHFIYALEKIQEKQPEITSKVLTRFISNQTLNETMVENILHMYDDLLRQRNIAQYFDKDCCSSGACCSL